MSLSRNGLAGYGCLRACLLWVLFPSAIITLLFHWRVFPSPSAEAVADATAYLPGLFSRTLNSQVYQLFISSTLGVLCYAVLVVVSLGARVRMRRNGLRMSAVNRLAHRLCGVPFPQPDHDDWRRFVDHGADYAIAPMRDAALIYPGLGFLGTVVGISISVGGLAKALASQDLTELTTGLRIAFDTTFFGLVASLLISLLVLAAQARLTDAEALDAATQTQLAAEPRAPEHAATVKPRVETSNA